MDGKRFDGIVSRQFEWCRETLGAKALEYETGTGMGEDKFHAFDRAAALLGCGRKRALAGMLAKHIVSVFDMCEGGSGNGNREYSLETWEEKITDSINYLLLLKAMVVEESEPEPEQESEQEDGDEEAEWPRGRFRAVGKEEMKN